MQYELKRQQQNLAKYFIYMYTKT